MSNFIIYALSDPRFSEEPIRYVGLSTKGLERPFQHWKHEKLLNRHDHCHAWIRSVIRDGFIPKIEILEEVSSKENLPSAERFWIASFRLAGFDLTNMNDGGEGQLNPDASVRKRQSEANIGNTNGKANRGKKLWSDEQKRRIGDQHRGKKDSEETRKKRSESHKGIPRTKEWLENQSKAMMGKTRVARTTKQCYACSDIIEFRVTDRRLKLPRVFCSLSCSGKFSRR